MFKKIMLITLIIYSIIISFGLSYFIYNDYFVESVETTPILNDVVYGVSIDGDKLVYGTFVGVDYDGNSYVYWVDTDAEWTFFGNNDWVACSYISLDYNGAFSHLG